MATVVIQKHIGKKRTTYALTYYDPETGKKKHYKSFKTYADAKSAETDLRLMLETGKVSAVRRKKKINRKSFVQVADTLKNEWENCLARGELSIATYKVYSYLLNVLINKFGATPMKIIKYNDVCLFCDHKAKKYSNIASNKYLSIFKKVFQCAVKLNAVEFDFTATIPYRSEKKHIRNRFLLPQELNYLVEISKTVRGKHYLPALIYLGAEHGTSKQEALSLKWNDIDFDYNGTGLIKFFRTKNSKKRTGFLMPRTKNALLEWKEHILYMRKRKLISGAKFEYVFCRIKTGEQIKNFDNSWKTALRKAKIKDFHYHDLRHTFCSNLILAGSGLKDVKDMIGHSQISMTDRYTHLTMEHMANQQKLLQKHYSNVP